MAEVVSRDGTCIVFERAGAGPAVILVDGALGSSALGSNQRLSALLDRSLTVVTYNRRGRPPSGDAAEYAVAREVDDIEALATAVGGTAGLYGLSSGAALVLEAGLRLGGESVTRTALYEAPWNDDPGAQDAWLAYTRRLGELLAEGRRGDAVALFLSFAGATDEVVAGTRRSPLWPALEAVARTLAYDAAVLGPHNTVPVERAGGLRVPALVMNGGAGAAFMRESAVTLSRAIPDARYLELAGQRHDVDPAALVPPLTEFFLQSGAAGRAA